MAGRYGPVSVFLLVDGYNLIGTSSIRALQRDVTAILEKTDGLGTAWEKHTPVGQSRAEYVQEGAFFDTAAGASHAALKDLPGSPQAAVRIVNFGFAGDVIGNEFDGFEGVYQGDYKLIAARGVLQKADASSKVTGRHNRGQILQILQQKTADWDTESTPADYTLDVTQRVVPITSNSVANPSVVTTPVPHGLTTGDIILISGETGSTPTINGERVATVITTTTFSVPVNVTIGGTGGSFVKANSTAGGAGFLQCTQAAGFTNFIGKVRDSADDITYADLVTFADNVSAPFAERVEVSGVVDRYLAIDGDVTGAGTITVWMGFARH
ncbi:MAG: hypothetical protein V3U85_01190 [Hyphomicrobium sp.]